MAADRVVRRPGERPRCRPLRASWATVAGACAALSLSLSCAHPPASAPAAPAAPQATDAPARACYVRNRAGSAGPTSADRLPGLGPPKGTLDKEIVRRIIRRHASEVSECYGDELASQSTLEGRVVMAFTIDASGKVVESRLAESTIDAAGLVDCIGLAVCRWEFPRPTGGGQVRVTYPFVLKRKAVPILGNYGAPGSVRMHAVEPGLLVHESMDSTGRIPSNGLVVVLDEGLLLIDTAWNEAQTDAILRWGEQSSGKRWIGAVVTHAHSDRAGGVGALLRRGILVQALDLTVERLARQGMAGVQPLFTAAEGHFADPRGFEALYAGAGHAPDNIVIWFPRFDTLFGGCLIKSAEATMLGFTGDADLRAWPSTIARVREAYPSPTWIVPGHGAVAFTTYRHTLDLLGGGSK